MEKYESPMIKKIGTLSINSLRGSSASACSNHGNGTGGGDCNGKGNTTK